MKKCFFILFAVLFVFALNAKAQEQTNSPQKASFLLILKHQLDSLYHLAELKKDDSTKKAEAVSFKRFKIDVGGLYAPVTSISLKSISFTSLKDFSGSFKTDIPAIYAFVSFKKGNWSFNPFFLTNSNSVGAFLDYSLSKTKLKPVIFLVGTKSLKINDLSAGAGVLIPVFKWEGKWQKVVVSYLGEIKSPIKQLDPFLVVGFLCQAQGKIKK